MLIHNLLYIRYIPGRISGVCVVTYSKKTFIDHINALTPFKVIICFLIPFLYIYLNLK